jgi:hypothetical protein
MTTSAPENASDRPLLWGTLAWLAFSIIAVAVRGVRWEETWEHALIISRAVPYPEGHPMFLYCRSVFSGQSYLAALLLTLFDSPLLINGLWNVLQLAFCTVPVFLLGARLGGRALAGHAAAALVLFGVHRGFQSYYPIETWPHFYAVGQIGAGYALLCLACLACGWQRAAWFLLGLMPAVHIGQWPVAGAVAGLHWLYVLGRGRRQQAMTCAAWFLAGLAPCVLFAIALYFFRVAPPEVGAYAATGDAQAIWAAYSERHDIHRFVPRLNPPWKSAIGAGLALLLSGGAVLHAHRTARAPYAWAAAYAAIAIAAATGIGLLHRALGSDTPFLLIAWMPYRLANHLAVLLVPLSVGILLNRRPAPGDGGEVYQPERGAGAPAAVFPANAGAMLITITLLYSALYPVWSILLPEGLFTRYAGNPEAILFALCGAAFAALAREAWAPRWPILVGAAVAGLLAALYPFGLAAAFAGAAAWFALACFWPAVPPARNTLKARLLDRTPAAAIALLLLAMLAGQWRDRESLPRQAIHERVSQYLSEKGEPNAMLATPYWDVEWLGKTRHPIFADYQTAHLMTYMPALAPALKKMHAEVFGFTLDGETGPPLAPWPARTPEEWRHLASAYGFDYVLAPAEMTLTLERVLEGEPYDLYRVWP